MTVKRAGLFQDFHIVECAFSPLPELGATEFSHFACELKNLRSLRKISGNFTGDRDTTIERLRAAFPDCEILDDVR